MKELITRELAEYAYEIVKTICAEVGPGMPATPQERARAMWIKRELETHLGAENVSQETFDVAPWAWLSSIPLSATLLLIAALLNLSLTRLPDAPPWITPALSLVFALLVPLPFFLVFVRNLELLDGSFPQKPSVNVIGSLRRPETQNIQRLLILSAHHDSAPENTWFRFLRYGFIPLTAAWMIAFVTMPIMSLIQLTGVIAGNAGLARSGTLGWVLLAFPIVPAILYGLFFNRGRKNGGNVPGAVDNLSGCAVVVALSRFLVQHPACIPEDTEIRLITFGSEEAGLRGSRRYVERHLDELQRLDTRVLNFETIARAEIGILTSEANGMLKVAPEMVNGVIAAAERAGVPYRTYSAYLGASNDSGPFCQAGIKAITLLPFKMPEQVVAFYHTNRDVPQMLKTDHLLNVLKLALEWVRCGGE